MHQYGRRGQFCPDERRFFGRLIPVDLCLVVPNSTADVIGLRCTEIFYSTLRNIVVYMYTEVCLCIMIYYGVHIY